MDGASSERQRDSRRAAGVPAEPDRAQPISQPQAERAGPPVTSAPSGGSGGSPGSNASRGSDAGSPSADSEATPTGAIHASRTGDTQAAPIRAPAGLATAAPTTANTTGSGLAFSSTDLGFLTVGVGILLAGGLALAVIARRRPRRPQSRRTAPCDD